ncbi:TIGR03986 family CRISPR-associated RAMP protein (plasmid) [Tistrella mobilis]|uniref:TIGR03986 family type III CRISPR-associated RAMP protein n=1 Tax=Tistrella mobilis TaxID=171437 RepID=UPI00355768EC
MTDRKAPFINNYQFVDPAEAPRGDARDLLGTYPTANQIAAASADIGGLTHDRWVTGRLSGYIDCRLTVETPLVLGGEQTRPDRGDYATVAPFRLHGEIALPGSSLRGMISAVAEIASGSAPRILDRRELLSYRVPLRDALSAVGRIEAGPNQSLVLRPLALPTFAIDANFEIQGWSDFRRKWERAFNSWRLKTYFGYGDGDRAYGRLRDQYTGRTATTSFELSNRFTPPSFDRPPTITADRDGKIWMETPAGRMRIKVKLSKGNRGGFVLGLLPPDDRRTGRPELPRPAGSQSARPGWVRLLERGEDTPKGKTHDLFVDAATPETPALPLDDDVLRDFKELAREAWQASEGVHPRNANRDDPDFRPRPGDLVFFDMSPDGRRVQEITYSSAWRRAARHDADDAGSHQFADVHHFFEQAERRAGRRLRPLSPATADARISRAEALFGFVADADREQPMPEAGGDGRGRAYAGRVTVDFARLEDAGAGDAVLEAPVVLRILSSPKLPSSELYFHEAGGRITDEPLATSSHRPNGIKRYVHDRAVDRKPSQTDALGRRRTLGRWHSGQQDAAADDAREQKLRVTPITPETRFTFRVRFDNLDRHELELLAYALRPDTSFRHKLGLGRGIGLGTVEVEPLELVLIDRIGRYTDPFTGHQSRAIAADAQDELAPYNLAKAWRDRFQRHLPETAKALEALGKPPSGGLMVMSPRTSAQPVHGEEETFKWSADNKKSNSRQRQVLGPVTGGKLRTLLPDPPDPRPRDQSGPRGPQKPQRSHDRSPPDPPPERKLTALELRRKLLGR